MAKNRETRDMIVMEYQLNTTSSRMIWDAISLSAGVTHWFADSVTVNGKRYTFKWGKHEVREADLVSSRQGVYVRFHWLDEEQGTYFELRIDKNELTGAFTLTITDFAFEEEAADVRNLWDTSVTALRRCGI